MKKYLVMILLLLALLLEANKVKFRFIGSGESYFTAYKEYHYDEPMLGAHINAELLNIFDQYGLGGSVFYDLKSYDDRFDTYKFYEIYLHNYYAFTDKKHYFIYGFFAGFRKTQISYIHHNTNEFNDLDMSRPLFGFHYSTENWGMKMFWTQAENRKPVLGYELKLRSSVGLVTHIGRTNRGPIDNAGSEFYLRIGYELFY